ncbi:TPA: hypothetical protein KOB88_002589 [Clostridioides difficile]|nr:hypothetical protein [Clostridioides difficile]HBF3307661.1 hypothetical protein [Clostridioides difficile]
MNDFEKVSRFSSYLKYVDHQTYEICLVAVKQNGFTLQDIKWNDINLSKEQIYMLYLEGVRQSGLVLKFIDFKNLTKKQVYELCLEAVKQNSHSIFYIEWEQFNFSDEEKLNLCFEAVKQDKEVLKIFNWEKVGCDINADSKRII